MLTVTEAGLWCAAGGFHVDPSRAVDRALITHAHSDHARPGSRAYLCARACVGVLRLRVGDGAVIEGVEYGEVVDVNGVRVSFHPAGHVLGSAQIRLECGGEVWVVSGDYKTEADPTCAAFEPVRCRVFITESTFGLPVYRWPSAAEVFGEVGAWWASNRAAGRVSVLYGYSLGKAQRLLAGVADRVGVDGPVFVHPSVREFLPAYEAEGVRFPEVGTLRPGVAKGLARAGALVIAPPGGGEGAAWLSGLGEVSTAFASGWMLVRGPRRRRSTDRGFVVSDHADWPGLLGAIRATGAERVLVTHGSSAALVRWLNESGWCAAAELGVGFPGEGGEPEERAGSRGPSARDPVDPAPGEL